MVCKIIDSSVWVTFIFYSSHWKRSWPGSCWSRWWPWLCRSCQMLVKDFLICTFSVLICNNTFFTGTHWFLSSYWSSCQVFKHLHLLIGQKTKPSLFLNSHICHYCLLLWLTHWHGHILHVGEVHDAAGAVIHGSVHVCSCCGCKIKMIQLVIKQTRKKKERGQISGTCLICSQLLKRDTIKLFMTWS